MTSDDPIACRSPRIEKARQRSLTAIILRSSLEIDGAQSASRRCRACRREKIWRRHERGQVSASRIDAHQHCPRLESCIAHQRIRIALTEPRHAQNRPRHSTPRGFIQTHTLFGELIDGTLIGLLHHRLRRRIKGHAVTTPVDLTSVTMRSLWQIGSKSALRQLEVANALSNFNSRTKSIRRQNART